MKQKRYLELKPKFMKELDEYNYKEYSLYNFREIGRKLDISTDEMLDVLERLLQEYIIFNYGHNKYIKGYKWDKENL